MTIRLTIEETELDAFKAFMKDSGSSVYQIIEHLRAGQVEAYTFDVCTPSPDSRAAMLESRWFKAQEARRRAREVIQQAEARVDQLVAIIADKPKRGFWSKLLGAAR